MEFLKQADYIGYVIVKPSKYIKIRMKADSHQIPFYRNFFRNKKESLNSKTSNLKNEFSFIGAREK